MKKLSIFFVLSFLVLSAFFVRLDIFRTTFNKSIDEIVYYHMAVQVSRNWTEYDTIAYGYHLQNEGRELPEYFFQPLYKHPPLFTFLSALSMRIFGPKPVAAEYISLLFGVLMIPLTYLLGSLIYNRLVGLMAAFFVYIDPISIITSQKVWPDTTLAFFMALSVYLFAYAVKREKNIFFIFCGFALGLALLTKYSGILSLFVILMYTAFYARRLFYKKIFYFGIFVIPLALLTPWFFWNYLIYGISAVSHHVELLTVFYGIFPKVIVIISIVGILLFYLKRKRDVLPDTGVPGLVSFSNKINLLITPILLGILALLLNKEIFHGLQFDNIPFCTWQAGSFQAAPSYFYFGRLLEFSLIYAFAFVALFSFHPNEGKAEAILRIAAFIILIFFTAWRNFQSRYILASIPFLIIMGVDSSIKFYNFFSSITNRKVSIAGRLILLALLACIILRTYHVNATLSYTNDMCYY